MIGGASGMYLKHQCADAGVSKACKKAFKDATGGNRVQSILAGKYVVYCCYFGSRAF